MEEITETYLNTQMSYCIDKNLEVQLDISSNKFNIPIDYIFKMAARKNTKREFLFVSRVIGKHLAIRPKVLEIAGAILARCWIEKREGRTCKDVSLLVEALKMLQEEKQDYAYIEDVVEILNNPIELKHKTLFIGFAETATGISQSVFNSFSNAAYIHTTREDIRSIPSGVLFKEEHSHAVDHRIFPLNPEIFEEYEDIVLIDDELTTGKTALNLLANLPGKNFGIISILDWRNEEFSNKDIKVCSLIKGRISFKKTGALDLSDRLTHIVKKEDCNYTNVVLKRNDLIEGYLKFTGRFGLNSEQHWCFKKEMAKAAEQLKNIRLEGKCLCIGTEEFIYIPCAISSEMGEDVYFQSTTRSPIYAKSIENYAINEKLTLKYPEETGAEKYLYNIPKNFYSQVFMFSEKPLSEYKKKEFADIFSSYNIKNIVFVNWECN